MDFFEDLFDFGDRKNRQGIHDGHHDHDENQNEDHDNRNSKNLGYDENMMKIGGIKCGQCSTNLANTFNYCPNCGTTVPRAKKCGTCGAELIPQSKFCCSCGAKICQL